jgi:hypothetical protein
MSFLAGIMSFDQELEGSARDRFIRAYSISGKCLPMPSEIIEGKRSILVQAGFSRLWEGPRILSQEEYDAVASGSQWRRIPNAKSTLAYLLSCLVSRACEIENYFDHFNCAVLDKLGGAVFLATDPIGIYPFYYCSGQSHLAFSSHQSFLRDFLAKDFHPDPQALGEYLIIGHNLGNKTLLKEIRALPPGARLICSKDKLTINRYHRFQCPNGKTQGVKSLKDAIESIHEHLLFKCKTYGELQSGPMAGFLSGGWDSRLLASLFARTGQLEMTYTSQQRIVFQGRIISEQKIAREVASFLGIKNQFVTPVYRNQKTRELRAAIVDYSTWFHDWAYTLIEAIPGDRYTFFDGILGDILLRGLYITPALSQCIQRRDRDRAIEFLHSQYLQGFNTYTRGVDPWNFVLQSDFLTAFSHGLKKEIGEQIHEIPEEDFLTMFLINNRSRRGISPLPRHLFGMKGSVALPFSDQDLLEKCLSIPLEIRLGHSFYKGLLERSKPGLSGIPSTNSLREKDLNPYLIDSIASLSSDVSPSAPSRGGRVTSTNRVSFELNGFPVLDSILTPEFKRRLRDGGQAMKPYLYFLERITLLESYFS